MSTDAGKYGEVFKCAFYVDLFSYFHSVGYHRFFDTRAPVVDAANYLYCNASEPNGFRPPGNNDDGSAIPAESHKIGYAHNENQSQWNDEFYAGLPTMHINFIAILNHNLGDAGGGFIDATTDPIRPRIYMKATNYHHEETEQLGDDDFNYWLFGNTNAEHNISTNQQIRKSINCHATIEDKSLLLSNMENGFSLVEFGDKYGGDNIMPLFANVAGMNLWWSNEGGTTSWHDDFFSGPGLQSKLGIGSYMVGCRMELPLTPNASLTVTYTNDGIESFQSVGGKTFNNINYLGPTEWINYKHPSFPSSDQSGDSTWYSTFKYPPFEIPSTGKKLFTGWLWTNPSWDFDGIGHGYNMYTGAKTGLGKHGKRVWELSFEFVDEKNMFSRNMVSGTYSMRRGTFEFPIVDTPIMTGGFPTKYHNNDTGDSDPITEWKANFFWVWQHTLGGKIPFLFTPNTDDTDSPGSLYDQFAICKFDNDSLQIRQVSHNLWNVSVSIREI